MEPKEPLANGHWKVDRHLYRRLLFKSIGSSGAPPTSRRRWCSLTELFRRYAPMNRRIIRCWRPCGQSLIVSFHETIGWTAAHPSVHPVLLYWSRRISVLFKLDHQIDRRFPPRDCWFIRRYWLHCLASSIHPAHLQTGPSVHPTVPVDSSLCTVY
jgi:hypothetical protein